MRRTKHLTIKTFRNRQVVDITDDVQKLVDKGATVCTIFVVHTTCAVTTADFYPGIDLVELDGPRERQFVVSSV